MKKIIVAALLLAGTHAFSQNQPKVKKTPEEKADMMTKRMKMALTLSDDQTLKAKDINLKSVQSMKEVKQKYRDLIKTDLKKIEDESDAQYKQVLSPEQYTKYLQLKENKKQKMKEKMDPLMDE